LQARCGKLSQASIRKGVIIDQPMSLFLGQGLGALPPLLRRSKRAILLDRGGRVLLIRFAGKKFHDPSQNGFEETDYHMLASDRERSVRRS
jgi:hypothetical protein